MIYFCLVEVQLQFLSMKKYTCFYVNLRGMYQDYLSMKTLHIVGAKPKVFEVNRPQVTQNLWLHIGLQTT